MIGGPEANPALAQKMAKVYKDVGLVLLRGAPELGNDLEVGKKWVTGSGLRRMRSRKTLKNSKKKLKKKIIELIMTWSKSACHIWPSMKVVLIPVKERASIMCMKSAHQGWVFRLFEDFSIFLVFTGVENGSSVCSIRAMFYFKEFWNFQAAYLHYHHEMAYVNESVRSLGFCCTDALESRGRNFAFLKTFKIWNFIFKRWFHADPFLSQLPRNHCAVLRLYPAMSARQTMFLKLNLVKS